MAPLPSFIAELRAPEFYPHRPSQVELRQTHISYVFLAGEYVYKVKKPVRFPFLDYSTLEKRLHFCREELRLNRRLAPKVYLDVVAIYQRGERYALADGREPPDNATVAEYAVKMRRLPEDRMLNRLLTEGKVGQEDIRAIAKQLVSFHSSAAGDKGSIYGAPLAIGQRIGDNFKETQKFIGRTISRKMFSRIQDYSLGFLADRAGLLEDRVRNQRVKEGHGDLRAEHICLNDGINIFDCIEFDERLRTCDVASEIAFLAMDFDFLNASELGGQLTAEYGAMARDETLPLLLPFYKCYRAYVRGKVESLKAEEPEVPEPAREKAAAEAERYFHLAYRYGRGAPKPAVLSVCGLVGTGKSTVARALRDLTGFQLLSSDQVRKKLAGVPPTRRATDGYREGIYSRSFTDLTYGTLVAEAEKWLKKGCGVIIDATFTDREHRRKVANRAADNGAPAYFIECRAREEEIFRRLKRREREADQISDATWRTYLRQRAEFAPLSEIPDNFHLSVNTEADLRDSIERFVDSL